ncbi:hypothetical protein CU110_12640 [Cobetia sp. ICG0124]|nr:hypothetical protein CU110_12640 [Cobetia sp. ICG0124]
MPRAARRRGCSVSQATAVVVDLQLAVTESEIDGQPLPASHQLEAWVAAALAGAMADDALQSDGEADDTPYELTVRLVEEEESRGLNRDYRGKDSSTNVLSFPHEPLDLDDFALPAELAERFAEEGAFSATSSSAYTSWRGKRPLRASPSRTILPICSCMAPCTC